MATGEGNHRSSQHDAGNQFIPYSSSPEHYSYDGMDGGDVNLLSYARQMHQHTKRQMEAASNSARRRTMSNGQDNVGLSAHARVVKEGSISSLDSTRS